MTLKKIAYKSVATDKRFEQKDEVLYAFQAKREQQQQKKRIDHAWCMTLLLRGEKHLRLSFESAFLFHLFFKQDNVYSR